MHLLWCKVSKYFRGYYPPNRRVCASGRPTAAARQIVRTLLRKIISTPAISRCAIVKTLLNILQMFCCEHSCKEWECYFFYKCLCAVRTPVEFKCSVSTLIDDGRLPKFKMAACKMGSGNHFWTARDGAAIPTSTPAFSAMPDWNMILSPLRVALSNIARHCQTLTYIRKSRWR